MKRLHVHVGVENLHRSIGFYSTLFGAEPAVIKSDYAKWMLEDPRVNFAISSHRQPVGVNHLGFQVETDEELRGMQAQLQAADARVIQEDSQDCCYARSDKYWVTDPSGIAWETFHTLGRIALFGGDSSAASASAAGSAKTSGCCAPETVAVNATIPVKARACCS